VRGRVSLLSPMVAFPLLWVLGVALGQIHLLAEQTNWSARAWLVMGVVPIAFLLGGTLGRELVASLADRRGRSARPHASRPLRLVLIACLVLGYAELGHQFAVAHSIPLFSSNMDAARYNLPGGPTVALLDLLTAAGIVAFALPRNLLAREARFELGVGLAALFGFALEGGRGPLLIPVATAFIARWYFWGRPSRRTLVLAVYAVLAMVSGVYFLRLAANAGHPYEHEVYNSVLKGAPFIVWPLVPLHLDLVLNFEALARLVDYFPSQMPFGHGIYDGAGFDIVIPNTRNLARVSAELSNPWVTSTVAGTLWADGGLAWVVIGVAVTGALAGGAYKLAQRTGEFSHALVAGYFTYHAIFNFYTNLWTQHADWLVVTPALLIVGGLAQEPERPPVFRRALARPWRRLLAASLVRPVPTSRDGEA
jgi:oligosaccharide repeat unit polymerase